MWKEEVVWVPMRQLSIQVTMYKKLTIIVGPSTPSSNRNFELAN